MYSIMEMVIKDLNLNFIILQFSSCFDVVQLLSKLQSTIDKQLIISY